jgi:nucleotide-binding universal stress UspA family protein
MKPILCALDEDEGSTRPLALAAELAEALGRELIAVHATTPHVLGGSYPAAATELTAPAATPLAPASVPVVPVQDEQVMDERRKEITERIERLVAEAGIGAARVELAVDASVVDALRRAAVEHDAAMLVAGSRGRGAARAALLGSTAHDLVSESPCPVVVVPVG